MIGSWLICIDRSFVNLSVLFYELSFYEVVLETLGWVVGFGVGGGVVVSRAGSNPQGNHFFPSQKWGGTSRKNSQTRVRANYKCAARSDDSESIF